MAQNPFEAGQKYEKVGCIISVILYIPWLYLVLSGEVPYDPSDWEEAIGQFFMILFFPLFIMYIITWILHGLIKVINSITNLILPHKYSIYKYIGRYIIAPVLVGTLLGYISYLVTGDFTTANTGFSLIGVVVTIVLETNIHSA